MDTNADTAAVADLKGSATYTGQAAGYYATRAAGSAEATSGRFTATTTLKANFDAASGMVPADQTATLAAPTASNNMPTPLTMTGVDQIGGLPGQGVQTTTAYYMVTVPAPGVSFVGSKIDKFMTEDGTMMEGWVVNLDGGTLRQPPDRIMVSAQAGDRCPNQVYSCV